MGWFSAFFGVIQVAHARGDSPMMTRLINLGLYLSESLALSATVLQAFEAAMRAGHSYVRLRI